MKRLTIIKQSGLLFILALFILNACAERKELRFKAELVKPPVATRQLGPSIFVPDSLIRVLGVAEGTPVLAELAGKSVELRIYKLMRPGNLFAVHKKYREFWNLETGQTYPLLLKTIPPHQARLIPKPVRFSVENYHAQPARWQSVAIGAPHGDCDLETGAIVKLVTQNYQIPSTAAYGARLSYRGIWYDVNRPLMKLPKKGGGVIPERVWNSRAEEIYHMYQDSVWKNSGLRYGQRFKLFCSFHGHDLTVKLADGKVIQRPVIEAMGIGFRKSELRKIKTFYNQHKTKYFENPPLLVFGNLPEDRVYEYQSIPLTFFYSGLGTRVYGSLRSDLIEHGLHMETPNSMRLNPEVQPHTARFLHDLYEFVMNEILAKRKDAPQERKISFQRHGKPGMVKVKGGVFPMGAPKGVGWSGERPQHQVKVDPFQIDRYEVTNRQYAEFLNQALNQQQITVTKGVVRSAAHPDQIWLRTYQAAPMSHITYRQNRFKVLEGKEDFPVIFVSWYGAKAYARWLGGDLPTEAEWEMAASWDRRNNKKYLYGYASDMVDSSKANFEDSGDPFEQETGTRTTPSGFYRASSPSGAYDMSGNVMEWCRDYYQYGYYKHAPQGVWDNPAGPETGTMRTVRGGAWNLEPWVSRTTFRLGVHPNATLVNVGFRCVKR